MDSCDIEDQPSSLLQDCQDIAEYNTEQYYCKNAGFERGTWQFESCINAAKTLLENVSTTIMNDQDAYYNGVDSQGWEDYKNNTLQDEIEDICDREYHPDAEELIDRRRCSRNKAEELAQVLFEPYLEQYTDYAKVDREEWFDQCVEALNEAVDNYEDCLRENWDSIRDYIE